MMIKNEDLKFLVPQKGKMFLIGEVLDADIESWKVESRTMMTENSMFFDKEAVGVPNYVCFELAAQTVAALTGLNAREKHLEPNMGLILSVSNFHFDFNFIEAGKAVNVKVFRESEMDNIYSFCADFFIDEKHSGSGKLTLMEMTEGK